MFDRFDWCSTSSMSFDSIDLIFLFFSEIYDVDNQKQDAEKSIFRLPSRMMLGFRIPHSMMCPMM